MTEKVLITNNGNFLRYNSKSQQFYFQKPNGEFLRQVSNEEADYIGPNLILAEIEPSYLNPHPELPVWKYVGQFNTLNDYTNYKPETCNNGGDYSFHEYSDFFVAKINDKWVFREVVRKTTSAEFDYDELNGQFNHTYRTNILNSDWEDFYWSNEYDVILEQISNVVSFEYIWNLCRTELGNDETTYHPITFSERKWLLEVCHDLGVDLRQGYVQNKIQRNGKMKKGWSKI